MLSLQSLRFCFLCLSLLLAVTRVQAQYPDPNDDPFYDVPDNVSSYSPGEVINSRKVQTLYTLGVAASYQILYRTNGVFGEATATVATVWVPAFPASPSKILLYGVAEDALNIDCAPSFGWVNSTSQLDPGEKAQAPILIPFAATKGYYVVSADAEGPNSAFLAGLVEGHSALDGVRGAIDLLSLDASSTRVAIYGYSGGAHTTIWAASLAGSYAPELKIVGAASGGTPVDLQSAYELVKTTDAKGLAIAALLGLGNAYPELNRTLTNLLTPQGKLVSSSFRAANYCNVVEANTLVPQDIETLLTQPVLSIPEVVAVLKNESLLDTVSPLPIPVPKFPRLQYHGSGDQIVPYAPAQQYVQQQCGKGADIRFVTFPGLNHETTAVLGVLGALQFVSEALDGTVFPAICGTGFVTFPLPGSPQAAALLGPDLSKLFCQITNCQTS